jgi:hypothetical protein
VISAVISRTTRLPVIEVSGIAARHSLVTSSMTVSTRKRRPFASWSCTKSVDQRLFGPAGLGIGVRATAIRRRDRRRRTLRFTDQPSPRSRTCRRR